MKHLTARISRGCVCCLLTRISRLLSSIADWVQLLTRAQQAGRHQFVEQQLHSLVEALRVHPTAVDARLAAKLTGLARECPLALRPRENMLVRACATLLRAAFSIGWRPDSVFNELPVAVQILLRLLTREYAALMRKSNALCCLAATALELAFRDADEWPLEFLQVSIGAETASRSSSMQMRGARRIECAFVYWQVYVQDAIDARFWVDAEACRPLVEGVLSVFAASAASAAAPAASPTTLAAASTLQLLADEEEGEVRSASGCGVCCANVPSHSI